MAHEELGFIMNQGASTRLATIASKSAESQAGAGCCGGSVAAGSGAKSCACLNVIFPATTAATRLRRPLHPLAQAFYSTESRPLSRENNRTARPDCFVD